MALTTKYPGPIVIADLPENIVFGTCMLGDNYGTVESATVKRTADREELEKCGGNLLAVILRKARFELTLKTVFSELIDAPGLGAVIDFPLAGISGRALEISVDWEKAGQRMLSIEASSWDSFNGQGAGYAYAFNAYGAISGSLF